MEIPEFGLTLERVTPRLSVQPVFMQSARASKVTLEWKMRVSSTLHVLTVRSSGECTLERGLVSHARVGIERPLSVNFAHPILLL